MAATRPQTAYEAIENSSRDEISALQLARLKKTLQHVYANVPHYRRFDIRKMVL